MYQLIIFQPLSVSSFSKHLALKFQRLQFMDTFGAYFVILVFFLFVLSVINPLIKQFWTGTFTGDKTSRNIPDKNLSMAGQCSKNCFYRNRHFVGKCDILNCFDIFKTFY